jgi:cyclopropane-fatty-acyl-phospholipid synthase
VKESRRVEAARRIFNQLSAALQVPVSVRLWDGSLISLDPGCQNELEIAIAGPEALGALLKRPSLEGLVAVYASGGIDLRGGDPIDLLQAFRDAHGKRSLRGVSKLELFRSALPLVFQRGVPRARLENAFPKDAEPVSFHYDVGNDFYALFLDPEMQYSCGYFADWKNPLERAQQDKLEMICRKLRLAAGERFLDVGCGWGGLVCHAALHYDVRAHGVTLSPAQLEYARARVLELGLEDRVTLELRDYRDLTPEEHGEFDKIASVGMIEHVGIANYPAYFSRLAGLLRHHGLLLNHGITRGVKKRRRRRLRSGGRAEKRLIASYVFPGHELDHLGHTIESLEGEGFEVRDVENWREHYAQTTQHWCRRLFARRAEAERLVGRERSRTWLAYLAGVSSAFHDGSLRIHQVLASRHRRKGSGPLPPTREDLYR